MSWAWYGGLYEGTRWAPLQARMQTLYLGSVSYTIDRRRRDLNATSWPPAVSACPVDDRPVWRPGTARAL
ncbi:MAG: hypothetical protein U0531_10910 [Dehalococcoidia bacterium]